MIREDPKVIQWYLVGLLRYQEAPFFSSDDISAEGTDELN